MNINKHIYIHGYIHIIILNDITIHTIMDNDRRINKNIHMHMSIRMIIPMNINIYIFINIRRDMNLQ